MVDRRIWTNTPVGLPCFSVPKRVAGQSSRYCPAGAYKWVENGRQGRRPTHRNPEPRATQYLRHQGSQLEHQLGAPERRRKSGLSEYVVRSEHGPSLQKLSRCDLRTLSARISAAIRMASSSPIQPDDIPCPSVRASAFRIVSAENHKISGSLDASEP
jgi:hypothetical protein